jgi:hypothetical protein
MCDAGICQCAPTGPLPVDEDCDGWRVLPDDVRTRTLDPVRNGPGKVELRTRVESNETELVLVPTDGTEPMWLARTGAT